MGDREALMQWGENAKKVNFLRIIPGQKLLILLLKCKILKKYS